MGKQTWYIQIVELLLSHRKETITHTTIWMNPENTVEQGAMSCDPMEMTLPNMDLWLEGLLRREAG